MTDANADTNRAFLQAGVRWTRAVLEARVAALTPDRQKSWWQGRKTTAPHEAEPAEKAREAMSAATSPQVPIEKLAKAFGLSPFERDLLLLAASPEIDTGMPGLIADAQGDPGKRFPTFGLGMALFADPSWDALSPERPLRAHRLLEVHQSGAASLLAAPLRIDERIAAYIKGLNYLDERLASLITLLEPMGELAPSQEAVAATLAGWLTSPESHGLVQLTGIHRPSKVDVARRAATLANRQLFAIHADALPTSADDLATFVRLWSREARLQSLLLLVQGIEGPEPAVSEDGRTSAPARWPRVLGRLSGPVLLDVRQAQPDLDLAPVLTASPPTDAERRARWKQGLTIDAVEPTDASITRLAGEYKTSLSQIDDFARRATMLAGDSTREVSDRVTTAVAHAWNESVHHAGAALSAVTRWIGPRATIDDVRLPASEKAQLARLIRHARQRAVVAADFGFSDRSERGLGLTALFHGESGTGKTLAAEAVAHALGLGLAVVDMATVKSKYIGETEKNLRRIFDAAEAGGAVLCFDEADTFFGRRSEVKDSHDRYANIEINYLLMRMERFSGVAILATNQKHALDPAFMRRLRFVIGFPFPGQAERTEIWQTVFPVQTPLDVLDFDRLGRFPMTGGSIFSAAIAAAHAAAADESHVTMSHLLEAIRWEFRKLERPIAESEFREIDPRAEVVA
jgi:hypothetical protein